MALEHVCVVPWFDGVLEAAGELEELGIVLEHPPEQRSQLANGIQLRHLKVVVVPCTASWACQSPAARSIFACMHICMYAFIRGSFCPGYNMTGGTGLSVCVFVHGQRVGAPEWVGQPTRYM